MSKGFDDKSSKAVSLFSVDLSNSYGIKYRLGKHRYGRQDSIIYNIRKEIEVLYVLQPTAVTLLGRTPLTRGKADSIGMSGAFRITSIVCIYPR